MLVLELFIDGVINEQGIARTKCPVVADKLPSIDHDQGRQGDRQAAGYIPHAAADRPASQREHNVVYPSHLAADIDRTAIREQIDTITRTLQSRCGSFCRPEDVILYKVSGRPC